MAVARDAVTIVRIWEMLPDVPDGWQATAVEALKALISVLLE
jgi:uncharacterized protein YbdZ (MbtH family)